LAEGLLNGAASEPPLREAVFVALTMLSFHALSSPTVHAQSATASSDPSRTRESAARCRRIRATAESSAYLMFSPTLWAEGVHVPVIGDTTGMGYTQGAGWQLRGSLSFSPLDMARGAITLDAAGSECRQIEALARAHRILEIGDGVGELPARRAERASFVASQTEIDDILHHAEERLAAGLATEEQLAGIRTEIERLARRVSQLDGDIDRLVDAGHEELDASTLRTDLESYERAAMDLERQRSTMRRMNAWTITVRAGVIPQDQVDWFGQLQVGFNLGGIAQQFAEDELVDARADDLAESEDELRTAVARLEERLRSGVTNMQADLEHVRTQIAIRTRQRELIATMETADTAYLRAMIDLELVGLRAEAARLAAWIEARAAFAPPAADATSESAHE
jgi:hypothetical protein